jgi:hypothetical protein
MNGRCFQLINMYNALVYCSTKCVDLLVCVQIVCVFSHVWIWTWLKVCACIRGDGMGRGQEREGCRTGNYTFGCICKSSMKMIIEKVLIDRISVIQVDPFLGFINTQFLSCFHMITHLCYICHLHDVFCISKGVLSINYNLFCKICCTGRIHKFVFTQVIQHSW